MWPEQLTPLFENAVTVEYVSLTRSGVPICVPTTPYVGNNYNTLDVSTGLTYPAKAERARRNPKVCLLYGDPIGCGLPDPSVVMVQGFASVRDSDIQANTDRYVKLTLSKLPAAYKGKPRFALRMMPWYFARIWIEITPIRIYQWEARTLQKDPLIYTVGDSVTIPSSDPAPAGKPPPPWIDPPASWQDAADIVTSTGDGYLCDITTVDDDGFPVCQPVARVERNYYGFSFTLGRGALPIKPGSACATFHTHPDDFTGQQNRTFVGRVVAVGDLAFAVEGGAPVSKETTSAQDMTYGEDTVSAKDISENLTVHFQVDRVLGDWSLAGNQVAMSIDFLRKGFKLRPRLRDEAARRGQPVPKVRL
ncbi:MAG: hypothetical protein M1456_01830 [Actinobacteria bacterium]|nr:hypothetical protein [Actinomycetota bacterium]